MCIPGYRVLFGSTQYRSKYYTRSRKTKPKEVTQPSALTGRQGETGVGTSTLGASASPRQA